MVHWGILSHCLAIVFFLPRVQTGACREYCLLLVTGVTFRLLGHTRDQLHASLESCS